MNIAEKVQDQAERRLDFERRQFNYTFHIPERRSGKDRRYVLKIASKKAFSRHSPKFFGSMHLSNAV